MSFIKKIKNNKSLIVVIIILSLIILTSIGTFFFLSKKKKQKSNKKDETIKTKKEKRKKKNLKIEKKPIKIKECQIKEEKSIYESVSKPIVEKKEPEIIMIETIETPKEKKKKTFKERLEKMKFDFKKNERLISIAVVLFLVLIVFVGTNSRFLTKQSNQEIKAIAATNLTSIDKITHTDIALDEVVLTIGGEPITYEKYRYYCESIKKNIDNGNEAYWFETNTTILTDDKANQIAEINTQISKEELELEVIEKLKEIVVINKLAIEYDMEVSQEELDTKLQSIIDSVGEDEFNKVLIENNISRTLYVDILKSTMQEEKLLKVLFYDEIKTKMEQMDIARVKHILITYNDEIITSSDITNEMEDAINQNVMQGIVNSDTIVYESQEENSTNIGELKENENITIKSISEDGIWYTISYNNNDAFVKSENITLKNETTISFVNELTEEDIIVKQLTKQEAYDLSKDILIKLENGKNFDILMQQYTEDATMIDNPNGYYIVKNEGVEETEIEKTAFELNENEYSKIIETNLGFHIIYRCPLEETYIEEHILDYADDEIWLKYDNLLEQKTIGFEYVIGENYINAFSNVFYDSYEKYQKIKADNE